MQKKISKARYVSCVAILAAVATVLMYLEFSIPIVPSFIKFDFSEMPALLASYALGPIAGILICFIKNLLHLFATTTSGVGELSNLMLGIMLVLPAGLIYQMRKTRGFAFLGAMIGSILMAGISMLTNYYITYPIYQNFMPLEVILQTYRLLCPTVDNLWEALAIFNLPFTFAKGFIDTIITFALYKFLSPYIKGYRMPRRKGVNPDNCNKSENTKEISADN